MEDNSEFDCTNAVRSGRVVRLGYTDKSLRSMGKVGCQVVGEQEGTAYCFALSVTQISVGRNRKLI